MRVTFLSLLSVLFIFNSCKKEEDSILPREIVEKAIDAHGANKLDSLNMAFSFRSVNYKVTRRNGSFQYSKNFQCDDGNCLDILSNEGFTRKRNDSILKVSDSLSSIYTSSLNSVVYFAQLPYSLDGAALNYDYLGTTKIKDHSYHKVQVTFDEVGGGEDFEDVFIYWIRETDYFIDYLAYSFCEEECGLRFRESVNRRTIKGVTFQDYLNYKPASAETDIEDLDELFDSNQLVEVSKINTDNIKLSASEFTR